MNDETKPADALAARTFTPTGGTAQADQSAQADEAAQAEEGMRQLAQATERGILAVAALARSIAARKLPELRDEVTDLMLQDWARAAVPVVGAHIQTLLAAVSLSPEGAALVVASLPIALGVLSAIDKHRRTIDMPATDGDGAQS